MSAYYVSADTHWFSAFPDGNGIRRRVSDWMCPLRLPDVSGFPALRAVPRDDVSECQGGQSVESFLTIDELLPIAALLLEL